MYLIAAPVRREPDLLVGQVQVYFAPIAAAVEYVRSGKLRPLAVTTAMRLEVLPGHPDGGRVRSGLRG